MRSNLWFKRLHASDMAVVLESMQTDLGAFAMLLPGATVIGALLIPTLNPVGHLEEKYRFDVCISILVKVNKHKCNLCRVLSTLHNIKVKLSTKYH